MWPKEEGRLSRRARVVLVELRGEKDRSLPMLLVEEMEELRWRSVGEVGLLGMVAVTWLRCF